MAAKKNPTPSPKAAPAAAPPASKFAFATFEQFYATWMAKYQEHGNYPNRNEAMRQAWDAARLKDG